MKFKAFESFGLVPFLFYILLGSVMNWIVMHIAEGSGLKNEISTTTGSWLFLIPAGFAFGLTFVAAFSRFTPQIRKTLGFMLGALLPLFWQHHSEVAFLAPFGLGVIVGLLTVERDRGQLKLVKVLAPVPFFLLLVPPVSEVVLSVQRGNYTQNVEVFLGYIGLATVFLIEALILRKTSNHALRDEETSEEVTIFLGPRQSGKTILSLGFYYALVTGKKGVHEGSFVISDEGVPLELGELYGIFKRSGFSGVKGTPKGWLTIHTFRIKRKPLEKFLFGMKDMRLEITDYAGEILWDLKEFLDDPKRYDDFVEGIKKDIEESFENFKNAIRYPPNIKDDEKEKIARDILDSILKDARRRSFDLRKYQRYVYWERVPPAIREKLTVVHTVSNLWKADKIVPLLSGDGVLYEMYLRDNEVRDKMEELRETNRELYRIINDEINKIKKVEEQVKNNIGTMYEGNVGKEIVEGVRMTLEAQLKAYDVVLSSFKRFNRNGDFAFLVTKADLIASIFMPLLIHVDPRSIRKRVLRFLEKTPVFINLAQKLIPEKQLEEKLMFSVVLSRADLEKLDRESAEELRDEILVRGLRELIEWVRRTPPARILREVVSP